MSAPARSLLVFGCYALAAGAGLIVVPALILGMLGFPVPADGWVRVVGVMAVAVGLIHINAARNESTAHFRGSVGIRLVFAALLAGLVVAKQMPVSLLLFAAIDVAGAMWTAFELRRADAGTMRTTDDRQRA